MRGRVGWCWEARAGGEASAEPANDSGGRPAATDVCLDAAGRSLAILVTGS